ncbi:Icc-related predicted phosphoesterase [Parabacteroides sp. PF5-5]|uniref:metallophosphoesterase family protein n=1 Tax=unclassified Parabacteroides TaxID=2649774 RepID=UPI002474AFFB|nr:MULTISPECIES: metallophosphoesterase [unclassified Parabacteroides]MDH6304443.1 Icc-related predicted phosphoesterase [Parabacteroides sp. PH5-39]MDH6315404.1 Icc-related predicted phosphoesterase [Parabacteroides sp. PF5-13]MDH6319102.1 Icc-related predicted phosphoesterase [Parabacteroides sp. PH5-13]MDH6322832.1 Icc-related predicted phosphoesterase [Parabacteroides sp. PH5-8]MDH6326596.1 Icc-related predicted phosphoesterase [Parabacteroides sp. PH5-41]
MLKKVLFLFLCINLFACDLIDYHPYDGRLDSDIETGLNKKNIERITTLCETKDTIRFAFMGDTQRSLDETDDFVKLMNRNDSIDFVIHGGDITDFGLKKEYEWAYDIFSKLKQPYVALIGNHDVLGNGDQVYKKLYGAENFSFMAGDVKFVCLNTNAIEYDYSHPIPDFTFIKNELTDTLPAHKRTIVVMHAPPGCEQFDNNVMDVFQIYIKYFPSLMFCIHAHNHQFTATDIFDDGIIYYGCENIGKRSYLSFTLTKEDYSYELIHF